MMAPDVSPPPTPPVIDGNDWAALLPAADASWQPHRTVSVCIPVGSAGPGLRRTLRALAAQTYPTSLFEVVVGVDGDDLAIEVPPGLPYTTEVASRPKTLEFGAGRARNTAASRATGEIVVFLDADVVPERQVLESYARWFERSELAVPMGLCRFVDMDDLDDDELVELVAGGDLAEYFAGADVDDQFWRERNFLRTDDLRRETIDAFRVVVGATIAAHRDQYEAVGGFPERGVRGVEDTEYGYRLHTNGAVLVLDRDADHWHQGRRNLTTDRRLEIDRRRAPYVERVLPVPGFRRHEPEPGGPVETVPTFRVHVGPGPGGDVTAASIERRHPTTAVVADEPVASGRFDPAFVRARVPAGTTWGSETGREVLDLFRRHDVGAVRVLADGSTDDLYFVRSRCVRRLEQTEPERDLLDGVAARFGVWWSDAAGLGLDLPGDRVEVGTVPPPGSGSSGARRLRQIPRRVADSVFRTLRRWAR